MDTGSKPFVFVLMPFASEFDDIYKSGIKAACQEAGAYCERVDEQIFQENILERVYNQTDKADIVISNMTGRNPNVFYETGFAHALRKHVILLTQHADDIPFDPKHYPHIIYEGKIVRLKDELHRRVRWAIDNPKVQLVQLDSHLSFFLGGNELTDGAEGSFRLNENSRPPIEIGFELAVQNKSEQVIDATSIELGLILPIEFANGKGVSTVILPDRRCMHLLPKLGRFLPNSWQPIPITIQIQDAQVLSAKNYTARLRIFREIGARDISFRIRVR